MLELLRHGAVGRERGFAVPKYQASLDALAQGAIETRLLVTDTISLADTPAVFESLKHRTSQCKALIAP